MSRNSSESDEEIQLHDDEGGLTGRKRYLYQSYNVAEKLEIVEWAERNSIHSANKKFGVDRKCIKKWIKQKKELQQLV